MSFTANTRPPAPKRERGGSLTWLFFLLILARPLWGIARSLVGPQVSNQQLWLMVGGVIVAGVVVTMIVRAAGGRSGQSRFPTPSTMGGPYLPRSSSGSPPVPAEWRSGRANSYPTRPPQFEPVLTGKVILVGFVLALLIGGTIVLVVLG